MDEGHSPATPRPSVEWVESLRVDRHQGHIVNVLAQLGALNSAAKNPFSDSINKIVTDAAKIRLLTDNQLTHRRINMIALEQDLKQTATQLSEWVAYIEKAVTE